MKRNNIKQNQPTNQPAKCGVIERSKARSWYLHIRWCEPAKRNLYQMDFLFLPFCFRWLDSSTSSAFFFINSVLSFKSLRCHMKWYDFCFIWINCHLRLLLLLLLPLSDQGRTQWITWHHTGYMSLSECNQYALTLGLKIPKRDLRQIIQRDINIEKKKKKVSKYSGQNKSFPFNAYYFMHTHMHTHTLVIFTEQLFEWIVYWIVCNPCYIYKYVFDSTIRLTGIIYTVDFKMKGHFDYLEHSKTTKSTISDSCLWFFISVKKNSFIVCHQNRRFKSFDFRQLMIISVNRFIGSKQ